MAPKSLVGNLRLRGCRTCSVPTRAVTDSVSHIASSLLSWPAGAQGRHSAAGSHSFSCAVTPWSGRVPHTGVTGPCSAVLTGRRGSLSQEQGTAWRCRGLPSPPRAPVSARPALPGVPWTHLPPQPSRSSVEGSGFSAAPYSLPQAASCHASTWGCPH